MCTIEALVCTIGALVLFIGTVATNKMHNSSSTHYWNSMIRSIFHECNRR